MHDSIYMNFKNRPNSPMLLEISIKIISGMKAGSLKGTSGILVAFYLLSWVVGYMNVFTL